MFHWNVIGCGGLSPFDGDTRVGAAGTTGTDGGAEVVRLMLNFVTKPSPQKIEVSPLKVMSKAPAVVGKPIE